MKLDINLKISPRSSFEATVLCFSQNGHIYSTHMKGYLKLYEDSKGRVLNMYFKGLGVLSIVMNDSCQQKFFNVLIPNPSCQD